MSQSVRKAWSPDVKTQNLGHSSARLLSYIAQQFTDVVADRFKVGLNAIFGTLSVSKILVYIFFETAGRSLKWR